MGQPTPPESPAGVPGPKPSPPPGPAEPLEQWKPPDPPGDDDREDGASGGE